MIKRLLLPVIVLLLPLQACYRPWTVIRSGRGSSQASGITLRVSLVNRLEAATLSIQKKGSRRNRGAEYRLHPFLSLLRVTMTLPPAPSGIYHLIPANWRCSAEEERLAIQTPATLRKEFRPGLYRSEAYARLLKAVVERGAVTSHGVSLYPELPLLPGERVTFFVLIPRISGTGGLLNFSLEIDFVNGPVYRRIPLSVSFPVVVHKRT